MQHGWGDDEAQPPVASELPLPLIWYLDCKRYNCLLVAGGLFDQPAWALLQMRTAGAAYDEELDLQAELEKLKQGQEIA